MEKKIDRAVPIIAVMFILAVFLLILLWSFFITARQHESERTELIALSNSLLHDNNRLIALTFAYTFSLDEQYLEEYLQLIGSPETFKNKIMRMEEIGLTDAETGMVEEIKQILDLLEEIETGILKHIENENYGRALETVIGDDYLQADFLLLDMTQNLIDSIEERSAGTTAQMNRQLQTVIIIFSIAYTALTASLYYIFRSNRRLREREREANEAKSRFLAMTSHEIRTPMNAILGITEMQLQNESISPETEDALSRIYESGSLLLNIINDILDLTKIEAGKLEINPVKYDVPSLINDTIQLNRLRFQSKLIDFKLSIDEKTPLNLFGDELRIRQILGNILSNAYKYTGMGRVKMEVSSELIDGDDINAPEGNKHGRVKDNDVYIIVTISDTGQGMTKEQLGTLFDEYTRYNKEFNFVKDGVGLGMSITKRLLDLLGGEIAVESEVNAGSAFTVRIPQKRVDELICGPEMSERLNTYRFLSAQVKKRGAMLREYMPYGSVLIVDDVASNLYVAGGLLVPYGLNIDTATGGREAIEMVKAGNVYDVIFMDHMMPGMDGIEAVRILREMGYPGSIVALTANAIVGQADIFLKSGFDDYVSKPIDSRELDRVLNTFIRDKMPPEIVEAARRERAVQNGQGSQGSQGGQGSQSGRSTLMQKQAQWQEQLAKQGTMEGLIEHFIYDAESAIEMLQSITMPAGDIKEDEIVTYEITIHGLKSSLNNVGEKILSTWAYKLEKAAHEGNLKILKEETPAIIDAVKAVINKKKGK